MRTSIIFFLALALTSCAYDDLKKAASPDGQTPLPHSMKGYELYSWDNGGTWYFTLITGTNRNKTYEEIVADDNVNSPGWVKITTHSLEDLKQLLSRVPESEYITWIGNSIRVSGFSLPSQEVVQEIDNYCRDHNLIFQAIN